MDAEVSVVVGVNVCDHVDGDDYLIVDVVV